MNTNVQILIDANNVVVGSYAGMHSDKGQTSEFVYVEYFPFNGFFGKARRYPFPVKKEHVHFVPAVKNGMDGIPLQIVFIYNPDDDKGLSQYLRTTEAKRMQDMRNKINELLNQKAALQQELLAAKSGAVTQLAESRKIVKTNTDDQNRFGDRMNPFAFNRLNLGGGDGE